MVRKLQCRSCRRRLSGETSSSPFPFDWFEETVGFASYDKFKQLVSPTVWAHAPPV